ncbi:LysM peptidoglycan-binding domain-containing protein [Streptomyces sp. IMTB 2501]|uniref:muramidase family protein n=1 Tax=Streptomyces sp. IMTB 2501 TaxID=1776340 RepID=UPI0015B868C4
MKAGVVDLFPRTASVWTAMQWFKNKGRWSAYPAVGAQVIYGTSGSTHTGLCVGFDSTWIYTVEGNTSLTNDANGNGVMRRQRRRRDDYVHGYGLPAYSEGIVTADPALKGKPGYTYATQASGPTGSTGDSSGADKYKIKKGQTLAGVAALLGVSLAALLAVNPQIKDPDVIRPDQEINVPKQTEKPKPPPEKPTPKPEPEPSKPPSGSSTYIVQKGDTLGAIAHRHGISLAQLLAWNPKHQADPNLVVVGQVVSVKGPAAPTSTPRPTLRPVTPKRIAPVVEQPSKHGKHCECCGQLDGIKKELGDIKKELKEIKEVVKPKPTPPPTPDQKPEPPAKPKPPMETKPPAPVQPEQSKPTDIPVVPQQIIPTPEVHLAP